MRLTSKMCSAIRKAARQASVGRAYRCELASRSGYGDYVLPGERKTMTNLIDVDAHRTDLFDKGLFSPQTIEASTDYPGCAIVEVWTYDRANGELLDTVYVGLTHRHGVIAAHCAFDRVKAAVVLVAGRTRHDQ